MWGSPHDTLAVKHGGSIFLCFTEMDWDYFLGKGDWGGKWEWLLIILQVIGYRWVAYIYSACTCAENALSFIGNAGCRD
jgi:hypothetical protein